MFLLTRERTTTAEAMAARMVVGEESAEGGRTTDSVGRKSNVTYNHEPGPRYARRVTVTRVGDAPSCQVRANRSAMFSHIWTRPQSCTVPIMFANTTFHGIGLIRILRAVLTFWHSLQL